MKSIKLQNIALAQELYGQHNNNLDKICDAFKVKINTRGNTLLVDGNPAEVLLAETLIKELYHLLENNFYLEVNLHAVRKWNLKL